MTRPRRDQSSSRDSRHGWRPTRPGRKRSRSVNSPRRQSAAASIRRDTRPGRLLAFRQGPVSNRSRRLVPPPPPLPPPPPPGPRIYSRSRTAVAASCRRRRRRRRRDPEYTAGLEPQPHLDGIQALRDVLRQAMRLSFSRDLFLMIVFIVV